MAEKKGRWGKKKEVKETVPCPVLPVRRTDYDLPGAVCVGIDNYFTMSECSQYMKVLKDEIDWQKQSVAVGDRVHSVEVAEPRLTLFMSDPGVFYEYSGRENEGVPWHPAILDLKAKAEKAVVEECGLPPVTFNCVQFNRYEGPRHALGLHSDNEPDLLKGAPIVSVTFGVTRDFMVQDRKDAQKKWLIPLSDGTLFVMGGAMQQNYLHAVPPGGDAGLRINLTFRVCIPRERNAGPAAAKRLLAEKLHAEEREGPSSPEPQLRPSVVTGAVPGRATAGGGRGNQGLPARSGTYASVMGGGYNR
eukprot:CAMPEP_0206421976 /NCGR_PEP_ID=MMETSP0324_2-20121206/1779_1 /ASSEMBLY_ACC=CAM_ASM_000836 /TAXON_ID=2866 /ORGANISM="Crypthecodinium cohnii, Strain Seligo" /LENGTH=303 /DNA_ID=CAMNT_0053886195 /DNA_START=48 /DNA_END=959 /DNA_ORIENTATION=-